MTHAFICPHCPTDEGLFSSTELGPLMEHLRYQHYVDDIKPRCRSCGEPVDPKMYDGLCGPCFMAKWGE